MLLITAVASVSGALYAWNNNAHVGSASESALDVPPPPMVAMAQDVLMEADSPTHTEPTPWGLFIINPVIDGKSVLNPQGMPYPQMDGDAAQKFEAVGDDAIARAQADGFRVIEIPQRYRDGMQLSGVESQEDGENFVVDVGYFAGRGTAEVRTLRVSAFTPTEPVTFEEFPDNAIWDFAASYDVNGFPTLTVFPDSLTADQGDERIIAWSQGNAVYYIRTVGVFENDELIDLAREISASEAAR
jgi:hypothetical protein